MAAGFANFRIEKLNIDTENPRFWWGDVVFIFDDFVEETEVSQIVRVNVRASVPEESSTEQMIELIYQKAVETLAKAFERTTAKTASDLRRESAEIEADKSSFEWRSETSE